MLAIDRGAGRIVEIVDQLLHETVVCLVAPGLLAPLGNDTGNIMVGDRSEERREGKSVSVRVDLGGRRIIKKKKQKNKSESQLYHYINKNDKTLRQNT